VHKHHIIDIFV